MDSMNWTPTEKLAILCKLFISEGTLRWLIDTNYHRLENDITERHSRCGCTPSSTHVCKFDLSRMSLAYCNDVWHNHEHQQQAYHLQCIWFLWDRNHFIWLVITSKFVRFYAFCLIRRNQKLQHEKHDQPSSVQVQFDWSSVQQFCEWANRKSTTCPPHVHRIRS